MIGNIAVVVTCYNEGEYILQAIRSVLAQTVSGRVHEIIVVDDGSDEPTRQVVSTLDSLDDRVRVIFQSNEGVAAARNRGAFAARSEWLAFLDGDDYWVSDKLRLQCEQLLPMPPDVVLSYSDYLVFTEEPEPRYAPQLDRRYCRSYQPETLEVLEQYFVHDGPILPSTVMVRRAAFRSLGGFDVGYRRAEETEFWLRLLTTYRIVHLPEALTARRIHPLSLVSNGEAMFSALSKVTDDIVEAMPELGPLKRKRLARRHRQYGHWLASQGARGDAVRNYVAAIRHDPSYFLLYLDIALVMMPAGRRDAVRRSVRSVAMVVRRFDPRFRKLRAFRP